MKLLLARIWPIFFLTLLVSIIFLTNYQTNTWLSGWDNLHPEFDFQTNIIDRSIYGVWQQYQGLGILSGNAHSADLIRQIFLLVSNIVIPTPLLRYFYHFSSLLIGSIGVYFLTKNLLKTQSNSKIASLSAGLIYILNLGTIQYFYVPYESFSHFYASLPWLLLVLTKLLSKWSKKYLSIFVLFLLLATPSFYIPTIFIVYLFVLTIFLTFNIISKLILNGLSTFPKTLKKPLLILTITFLINAFWLFPFVYFLSQGTTDYTNAKINTMFSEEAFLRNQLFGRFSDVLAFKSFLFDTTDYTKDMQSHGYMMQPWMSYLNNNFVTAFIYLLFSLSFIGSIYGLYKKIPYVKTLIIIEIISLIALINSNPPTGFIFEFIQNQIPLFKQIFRFPFTKFIVPMILTYSVFFGFAILLICNLITKLNRHLSAAVLLIVTTILLLTYWPVFQGNFIYPSLRVAIPQEYFDLITYFKTAQSGRIANLPQPTFWGWTSYKWGYRGSGFPWYGIKQPMLDRAFDVWSPHNEQYYQQLNAAISVEDYSSLEKVLTRYNIYYLWLDNSVIIPDDRDLLQTTKLRNYFLSSINFQQVFSEGDQHLFIFKPNPSQDLSITDLANSQNRIFQNVNLVQNFQESSNQIIFSTPASLTGFLKIPAMSSSELSSYGKASISNNQLVITELQPTITIDLTTSNTKPTTISISIPTHLDDSAQLFVNDSPINSNNQIIELSKINNLKIFRNSSLIFQNTFQLNFNTSPIIIPIQKDQLIGVSYPVLADNPQILPWEKDIPATNCFELGTGPYKRQIDLQNKYVEYTSFKSSSCDYFETSITSNYSGLITSIESQNISGRPLKVSLHQNPPGNYLSENILPKNSQQSSSNIIVPYHNIPNSKLYLEIDNYAVGQETKVNRLGKISIKPFPLNHLQNIQITPSVSNASQTIQPDTRQNPYQYISNITATSTDQLIILNQANHSGWQAYLLPKSINLFQQKFPFLFTSPLPKITTDWNNQWLLANQSKPSENTLVIIFWPQYIAINGFIVTGLTLLYCGIRLHPLRQK